MMDAKVDEAGLQKQMMKTGMAARSAATALAQSPTNARNMALREAAKALRAQTADILAANARDVSAGRANGMEAAFVDRLTLSKERIDAMASGLEDIAALDDPVGAVTEAWERPNGLMLERVRTPLGVIGIIYESRPNVTADAGGLCIKSGNAAILRGGSDSLNSARAIHSCLVDGLIAAGLPETAIQIVPTRDRAAVGMMLKGLEGSIDVIVPRGGRSLVERVNDEARVPVFSHLDGICHIFVHRDADPEKAVSIIVNAKMRRTGICGAAECVLIEDAAVKSMAGPIIRGLIDAGCEVRGDAVIAGVDSRVVAATESDFGKEFLASIIAMKSVSGLDEALAHIARYGSSHTESIITQNTEIAETFLARADSAIVMHNASTQFADGGEFGMGAEIGIATGRMHARGPVGVEQLTTFKYKVRGSGQTRP